MSDYRDEIAKVLEIHQIEWIGTDEGWDCGCNERGYLPAMPSILDAVRHQADAIAEILDRALAKQRKSIADDIWNEIQPDGDSYDQGLARARDIAARHGIEDGND